MCVFVVVMISGTIGRPRTMGQDLVPLELGKAVQLLFREVLKCCNTDLCSVAVILTQCQTTGVSPSQLPWKLTFYSPRNWHPLFILCAPCAITVHGRCSIADSGISVLQLRFRCFLPSCVQHLLLFRKKMLKQIFKIF